MSCMIFSDQYKFAQKKNSTLKDYSLCIRFKHRDNFVIQMLLMLLFGNRSAEQKVLP